MIGVLLFPARVAAALAACVVIPVVALGLRIAGVR